MRVIKHGELKSEVARIECRHCDSIFECAKSEGKYVVDVRDGDYIEIVCPVCSNKVNVDTKLFKPVYTG